MPKFTSQAITIDLPALRPEPIPVHFVTGLFGTGKTSLIQHWMDHHWREDALGLILCEEGQTKLQPSSCKILQLERLLTGCVCCEIAYSFFEVVLRMLRDPQLTRIVVELSAQADVDQMIAVVQGSYLKSYLHFEPIHLLVDPRNPHMRRDANSPLVRRLIHQAQVFVPSFQDAVSERDWQRCLGWMQTFEPENKTVYLNAKV